MKNPDLVVSVSDIDIVFVFDVVFVVVVVVVVGIRCNAKYPFALRLDRGIDLRVISFGIQPIIV